MQGLSGKHGRNDFLKNTCVITAWFITSTIATASLAQEVVSTAPNQPASNRELQRQIDELSNELQELRTQQNSAHAQSAAANVEPQETDLGVRNEDIAQPTEQLQVIAGDGRADPYIDDTFKKSVPLFGSDWRFSFGGYSKIDLIQDFSGTGDKSQFILASIPVDGNPPPGSYSNLQIRETRFSFDTRNTASNYDNNRFYLEMDFFDENDSTAPRLRHAYFQYGNLLAGRTWTLLTELRALPFLLDFAAGDSILGGRTEQIRWTQANAAKNFGWSVALENFDDEGIFNPQNVDGVARSDFPRLAFGLTRKWARGLLSVGGAITQLRWDGSNDIDDSSKTAYTVTAAGRVYIDTDNRNYLVASTGFTSGSITDIITFANGEVPNASVDADGNLDVAEAWNAQVGAHWEWNPKWSSNLSLAYAKITEVPQPFNPDFIKAGGSVHANVIYKFDERISAGLELMHGDRTNVSDRDGDAQRMQFSLIYYF